DLLAARHPREGVGDRDGEALLAHHQDRHTFLAERVVHGTRGIAADPRNALGLEDPREAVDGFDFHRAPPARCLPNQPSTRFQPSIAACCRYCGRSTAKNAWPAFS